MISGMVIDLCLCIRLLIPALGLRSLQYRLLLVVGDRMPVNDQTVELKTQELVFIGNMFVDPPQMARYATFVESNHMISTEPAKSIWRALYLYYTKYNALPDECDFVSIFGEKGSENLELGIAVAGSEETRASFILDTFADTMKANVFKQVSSKLAEIYEDGKVDNDKARKAIDSVYTKLSIIDRAASNTEEGDMASVFETWMDGKLQMQKPRIPIPIPGLGFMAGTPVGSVNVIVGSYGSGKEQPKSLIVPTPDGDRLWGSLRPGDWVFGVDGKPTQVLKVFDNGLKDIYRVTFDDGSSTLCGADHLWTVRGQNARTRDRKHHSATKTWQVLTTTEIMKLGVRLPHGKCSPLRQWEIPSYQPVHYCSNHTLPIHPYIMGLWLGDGDTEGRLCLNAAHTTVLDYLKHICSFSTYYDNRRKTVAYVSVKGIRAQLRELGMLGLRSYEKYIPTMYLKASVEDRIELLRGLMDSDGECSGYSLGYCYGSTSRNLCEAVAILIRSLAGKVHPIRVKHTWYKKDGQRVPCRDFYRINFALPNTIVPFRSVPNRLDRNKPKCQDRYLIRWIDSIEKLDKKEECMCIQVANPDGLYLTNDFIVTHNTSTLCTMAAELCKKHNVLYVTLETPAESLAFRVMSSCTGGAVPSSYVFLDPRAVDDNERDAVKYAKEAARTEIKNRHNVYFLDLPAGEVSPAQLALYLRNLHFREKVNIPVMIIDYAALMKTNAGTGREEIGWGYTGVILKELSAVAKSLGITIWVAAQAGGEKAHTVTTSNPTNFKPMRGNDLYGSKEVLQDASLVLGLSFLRSRDHPRLAAGVISTIKNRYGEEFYDFACTMDYSKSTIKSLGVLPNEGDGDCVDIITDLLRATELELEQMNKLQRKARAENVLVPMYKRPDRPNVLKLNQAKKPTPVAKTPPKALQQGEMNSQDAMY